VWLGSRNVHDRSREVSTTVTSDAVTRPRGGIRMFVIMWLGQLVSVVGAGMAAFALGLWVYQLTRSVTTFAMISVLTSALMILLMPIAGALVDRWDRRATMLASNLISAASALALAVVYFTGNLAIWHVYAATAMTAIATAFHWPAYSAATTMLVPKQQLGRAAGMVETARAASVVLAPLLAGALTSISGIGTVLSTHCIAFLLGAASLLLVHIPSVANDPGEPNRQSLRADIAFSWRFLAERPGLLRLLAVFSLMNLMCSFVPVLVVPLAASSGSADKVALTASLGASGFLVGGLVMSAWGGPQRRMLGVVACGMLQGIGMIITGLRPWWVLIALGLFCYYFWIPIVNGCSQAIWQCKIPPALQGRIFAIRRMLATATTPIAYLLAGILSDEVFNSLLSPDGSLANTVGHIIGVGDGRGVGLLIAILGLAAIAINTVAFLSTTLMRVEARLPDAV
jgi:MFS transporter, DHA3 family, macrolide efflux protein